LLVKLWIEIQASLYPLTRSQDNPKNLLQETTQNLHPKSKNQNREEASGNIVYNT